MAYKSSARSSGNGGKSKRKTQPADPRFRTDIPEDFELPTPPVRASTEPLKGQTKRQCQYMSAIENFDLVFATGPAGTGKTYICAAMAADALKANKVKKVIVTRPAVEAGESLGFLPGELEEKFDPYLTPFREVLEERLGKSHVENLIKSGRIEAAPLAYMRGRTFKDAFVILDEAQNTSPTQMKMFLTRIGRNAKVVVNGDTAQQDVRGMSGLQDAIRRVSFIPSVKHIHFTRDDIVRSGLVGEIIQAYDLGEDELKEVTPA